MAQSNKIDSTFSKGMYAEPLPFLSPEGTYSLAMNAIHSSRSSTGFGLVNEEARLAVSQIAGTIKGHSPIEERNQTLFFVYNGNSEIWLFNHRDNSTQKVCSDDEFDCKWGFDGCELLYGEFKEFGEACKELHVYWSSDCVYHVVNIDEMLNEKRKQAVIDSEDCTYFDVFSVTCGPHISAISTRNAGSKLEAGVIQFALQFQDNDDNLSNVFDISQPVYIESEDNIAGQVGTTSAKLRIQGLSKKWNNVIIYVIHTVGQITTIRKMRPASYGDDGFTFEYYGQKGELVDASVLLNKSKAWLRGQDLIQKDGRMFFYGIKNEKNLNYQKYANEIQLEYVEYEVSLEQQLKYHYPSLLRGEIYAFAIVFKFADGTYSHAYHIPGQPGGGSGASSSSSSSSSSGSESNAFGNSPGNAINPNNGTTQYCTDGGGNCVECNYCTECSSCEPSGEGASGSTASGGDSSTVAPISETYNPIMPSNFDTSQQYERKRNPSDRQDRPLESDKWEDQMRDNAANIQTNEASLIAAAICHDTLYGCGELETATTNDIEEAYDAPGSHMDLLSGYGLNKEDPDVNVTSNIQDAAVKLMDDAVTNREYVTQKRPVLNYNATDIPNPGETPKDPEEDLATETITFSQKGSGQFDIEVPSGNRGTIRADNWVDSLGNPVTEQAPKVVSRGNFKVYTSTIDYPDNKDCDGEFFYPQGKQTFHQVPFTSEKPHFVSTQNGVVNKYQPDNYEYGKTFVRPIGIKVTNIKFPGQDELPKPLCPKSPFKIVYVKRTDENKTIFAKAWLSAIFTGSIYGDVQAFARHGVNSKESVDRNIAAGADGFSRKGTQSDEPIYTAHGPDIDADRSFLPITKVRGELGLLGSGWTHGHYAEGKKPVNQWSGTKKDQRGTRVSNNLNHYTTAGVETDIVGFSYVDANTVLTKPPGMTYTLNNRFRESSLYLETMARLPGDERDNSFIGVVLDHFFPTQCNAPYVSLMREVPDLYGSVDGLKYIDLGINATQVHAMGTKAIEGICGDTWIGPYSKKRTSYVSNLQGNFFHPPAKQGSECREVSWCDSGEDILIEYMGIDHYPSHLPKSGDVQDPKNYAGLHTVAGACGAFGKSKTAAEGAAASDSESEFYWPRTLKSLVHTIIESHVNPALLQTGEGSQKIEGKVYYPKLKDVYLDSDAPNKHPWEESFLNRFYCAVTQPSKLQITIKTAIRTFLNLVVPVELLAQFKDVEAIFDGTAVFAALPAMMAFWVIASNVLFTDKRLNQMLGIGECKRDEEGGDLDEDIEQFEDHYCRYNWDYSTVNDFQSYFAFPLPFNTCDCDDCSKSQTNNEIYYSNKQNMDSEIDAYRNVKMNNFNELPAHGGKLGRLFILNSIMYGHCTDGMWRLTMNQDEFTQQIAFQQAGTGSLIEPQLLFEGIEGGFAGTQHPNAGIVTPIGYVFIDDVGKKIYRFTGSMPEEISGLGMNSFFKENLGFCNPKACYDEKTDSGIHYALGWDSRYNRLLVTKQDGSPCNSFTASFSAEQGGKWISFHSYIPQAYMWDRNQFFSIDYGKGTIYKHHTKGQYMTPFMVQFNAAKPDFDPYTFKSLVLNTYAEDTSGIYPLRDLDVTFDKVAILNSDQGTGWLNINAISDDKGITRSQEYDQNFGNAKFTKEFRAWHCSDLKDLSINCNSNTQMFIADCACQVIPNINQGLFDCTVLNKQDFNNRYLTDRFLTFRYEFNRSDIRLHLIKQELFTQELLQQ